MAFGKALRVSAFALAAGSLIAATPPLSVRHWDAPSISSDQWESHPAIDPRTGDVWFVRSSPRFSGWRLMIARCGAAGLAPPEPAPIAAPGLEADPYFADGGATLWFISSRATDGMQSADLDIWRARRSADGQWNTPERLPAPVSSGSAEWFPRPAPDGWLYFGSRRPGGMGQDDIWRARRTPKGWIVENAGPAFNTANAEYEFQPSPDGKWGILSTDKGLFRLTHGPKGWGNRTPYGPEVNATGAEIGPTIAPDGHSFLFSRDAGDGRSGELFVASDGKPRPWPGPCGQHH
jgi:hypothetical protein